MQVQYLLKIIPGIPKQTQNSLKKPTANLFDLMKRNLVLLLFMSLCICGISQENRKYPVYGNDKHITTAGASDHVTCNTEDQVAVKGTEMVFPSYSIKMFLDTSYSKMHFCPEYFNETYGGSYTLAYMDEGGSGMDSYPNITVGGVKKGGVWYPGDKIRVGMPVKIEDISETMHFEWETSQENAWGEDDKWMASINFIFDNYGTETSEPINSQRDFDIVVKKESHNFADDLYDMPTLTGNKIWFFARYPDGSLMPYEINIDGIIYAFAVRYKFFPEDPQKSDKVHVKFIPYGDAGFPHVLMVNVKEIIAVSKEYIQYADLPDIQRTLAYSKVAIEGAWLKAINAGYEVYTGSSQLNIERFKVNLDKTTTALNQTTKKFDENSIALYPNPASSHFSLDINNNSSCRVEIYNQLGKLVYKNPAVYKSLIIDTESNFNPGYYTIKIKSKEQKHFIIKPLIVN